MTSSRASSRASAPVAVAPIPAGEEGVVRGSDARARRSLAVSKSARDSISQVVESLRVSKPPRQPADDEGRRRHYMGNGGADSERVRVLEEALDAANTATVAVKRLYGRALVKRRAAERERDSLRARFDAMAAAAADNDGAALPASSRASRADPDDDGRSCHSLVSSVAFGDDRDAQLDSLADLVDMLEARLAVGATHERPAQMGRAAAAVARARATLAAQRSAGAVDTANVVAERDALRRQLDSVLKARDRGEDEQVAGLRAQLAEARADGDAMRARALALDRLRERAEAVGSGDDARVAALQTQLDEAKKSIARLVQERNALRRASRVAAVPPPPARPRSRGLAPAPPTNTTREEHIERTAGSAADDATPAAEDGGARFTPSEDVVRRVQTWRERAASTEATGHVAQNGGTRLGGEGVDVPRSRAARASAATTARGGPDLRRIMTLAGAQSGDDDGRRSASATSGGRGRLSARTERGQEHLLPARLRSDLSERAQPTRRAVSDALSERSVAVSEADSSTSAPHGIVGRHASLRSAAGAAEVLPPVRDFFGAPGSRSAGLRGLVSEGTR